MSISRNIMPVFHADNLSKWVMFHFILLNSFISLISAMKNNNILHTIKGGTLGFQDLHLPLLKFVQWFNPLMPGGNKKVTHA